MIFFKKKPIVLDFYTDHPEVMLFAKPQKASKFYPEWWKALPNDTQTSDPLVVAPTMKRCVGLVDLYQHGFILPMWSDLALEVGAVGTHYTRWQHADPRASAIDHAQTQRGEYLPDTHYQHLKLNCPWFAVCSENIDWMFVAPTWNFEKPEEFVIPAGVVSYKYQHTMNVNMFLPRKAETSILKLEQGQPMAHIVPITDREVEYRYHLVTTAELSKHQKMSLWFTKKYQRLKAGQSKCPFGGADK